MNVTDYSLPLIHKTRELTLEAMQSLASVLAQKATRGDYITLRGELGAGKTTFARAFIVSIAPSVPEVTSPTFNLMQSYEVMLADKTPETLWHLDLYRLESAQESEALGLREIEAHLVLVEWPEIIARQLPPNRLDIVMEFAGEAEKRTLSFYGNEAWRKRIDNL